MKVLGRIPLAGDLNYEAVGLPVSAQLPVLALRYRDELEDLALRYRRHLLGIVLGMGTHATRRRDDLDV